VETSWKHNKDHCGGHCEKYGIDIMLSQWAAPFRAASFKEIQGISGCEPARSEFAGELRQRLFAFANGFVKLPSNQRSIDCDVG
jgi:hypothetical protein